MPVALGPVPVALDAACASDPWAPSTPLPAYPPPRESALWARVPPTLETCRRVQQEHGIEIDPIYGGKVWTTMEQLESGPPAHSAAPSIVFWHCGFTPDWSSVVGADGGGAD